MATPTSPALGPARFFKPSVLTRPFWPPDVHAVAAAARRAAPQVPAPRDAPQRGGHHDRAQHPGPAQRILRAESRMMTIQLNSAHHDCKPMIVRNIQVGARGTRRQRFIRGPEKLYKCVGCASACSLI